MDKDKLIEKIRVILESYENFRAKTWEIGTDFYGSWSKLSENLKKIDTSHTLPTVVELKMVYDQNDKKRYKIELGGINITPITTKKEYAAESTIRQYLQEGSALGFIAYSEGDKITDGAKFSINPKIWSLKDNPNLLNEMLLYTLIKSTSSNIYFEINLGFSLFLSIIDEKDANIFNNFDSYKINPTTTSKVIRDFLPLYLDKDETKQFIKKIKGENTEKFGSGKRSYIRGVNELLNTYSFDFIIDSMCNYIDKIDTFSSYNTPQDKIKADTLQMIDREIQSKRGNLKKSIMDKRNIKSDEDYTDLQSSDQNHTNIRLLEACHIYDVWSIKEEARKHIYEGKDKNSRNNILAKLDDANNGILLNGTCHKMFDEGLVWFDSNGVLCYRAEHKKYVDKHFGSSSSIKIRDDVLNEKMKEYFKHRVWKEWH